MLRSLVGSEMCIRDRYTSGSVIRLQFNTDKMPVRVAPFTSFCVPSDIATVRDSGFTVDLNQPVGQVGCKPEGNVRHHKIVARLLLRLWPAAVYSYCDNLNFPPQLSFKLASSDFTTHGSVNLMSALYIVYIIIYNPISWQYYTQYFTYGRRTVIRLNSANL